MTTFVQHWVNNPDSNYGVLLRLQTEQHYNSMIFHSGQGPDSLKPKLEICYTLTTPPPPPQNCDNGVIIRGDRLSGKFTQLYLDSRGPNISDTTQPELGAAAWTCNAQGTPLCNFRSLLRYDVSDIPANAIITGDAPPSACRNRGSGEAVRSTTQAAAATAGNAATSSHGDSSRNWGKKIIPPQARAAKAAGLHQGGAPPARSSGESSGSGGPFPAA
jgi:hypothetical protein